MLAIKTILHPTDFSENSGLAFRLACAMARDYGARLVVAHVFEVPAPLYGNGIILPPPAVSREPLERRLRELQPADRTVEVIHRFIEGEAAAEILALAEETKADVIVMGTHGRTGLARLLMGSVAEQVVRKSPCPVVTVKTPPRQSRTKGKLEPAATGHVTDIANG